MTAPTYAAPKTLSEADPPAVTVVNPEAVRPVLLIADHAGNAVPKNMDGLGLSDEERLRHIAWDPGAAEVAKGLADRWQASAVLATYSRLLVDPNRPLGDPTAMPAESDGTVIPANQDLTAEERLRRAMLFYHPYHQAIDAEIARLRLAGPGPKIVSVHSFTPHYGDERRPWDVGIMAANDRRLAEALLQTLRARGDMDVGDNQPYSGITHGYTLRRHGGAQGLANTQIEIRQDLLATNDGIERWITILDEAIAPLINDPALLAIDFH